MARAEVTAMYHSDVRQWVWEIPQAGDKGDGWIVCRSLRADGSWVELGRWPSTPERHAQLLYAETPKMDVEDEQPHAGGGASDAR